MTAELLLLAATTLAGDTPPWPFPWPEDRVARYEARRTSDPIVVDGRLDEPGWKAAPRSPRFSDLVRGAPGIHDTRAAVLWDDEYLYVGYWVEEPFVEGTLTERDSLIYKNNDVELFIAGRDAYYELEINSLGTIYEVFFVWEEAYERAGYAKLPEFDRAGKDVRPFGGVGFKNHPRGRRIGFWRWDLPGLRSAVHVDGTVNDNADRDRGWTVEIAVPWTGLAHLAVAVEALVGVEAHDPVVVGVHHAQVGDLELRRLRARVDPAAHFLGIGLGGESVRPRGRGESTEPDAPQSVASIHCRSLLTGNIYHSASPTGFVEKRT